MSPVRVYRKKQPAAAAEGSPLLAGLLVSIVIRGGVGGFGVRERPPTPSASLRGE